MRIIKWNQPARAFSDEEVDNFYNNPLSLPTLFKFHTSDLVVPEHRGAFSFKTVLSGTEVYRIGRRTVRLRPGEMMFINADEEYSSMISESTDSLSIFFPEQECDDLFDSLKQAVSFADGHSLSTSCSKEMPQIAFTYSTAIANKLYEVTNRIHKFDQTVTLELVRPLVMESILEIMTCTPFSALDEYTKRSTKDELLQRLLRAKTKIDDTAGECANIDDLADIACLSKYYFLRLFKNAFGQTPAQYARSLRLKTAISAIKNGVPVEQAARCAGYRDMRSFRRACARGYQLKS